MFNIAKQTLFFFYWSNGSVSKPILKTFGKLYISAVKVNDVSHNYNFQREI